MAATHRTLAAACVLGAALGAYGLIPEPAERQPVRATQAELPPWLQVVAKPPAEDAEVPAPAAPSAQVAPGVHNTPLSVPAHAAPEPAGPQPHDSEPEDN